MTRILFLWSYKENEAHIVRRYRNRCELCYRQTLRIYLTACSIASMFGI